MSNTPDVSTQDSLTSSESAVATVAQRKQELSDALDEMKSLHVRHSRGETTAQDQEDAASLLEKVFSKKEDLQEAEREYDIAVSNEMVVESAPSEEELQRSATRQYWVVSQLLREACNSSNNSALHLEPPSYEPSDHYKSQMSLRTEGAARVVRQHIQAPPEVLMRAYAGDLSIPVENFERATTNTQVNQFSEVGTTAVVPETYWGTFVKKMQYAGPMLNPRYFHIIDAPTLEDIHLPAQSAFTAVTEKAEGAELDSTEIAFHAPAPKLEAHIVGGWSEVTEKLLMSTQLNDWLSIIGDDMMMQIGRRANQKLTQAYTGGTKGANDPKSLLGELLGATNHANNTSQTLTKDHTTDGHQSGVGELLEIPFLLDNDYTEGARWMMNRQLFGKYIRQTSSSRFESAPVMNYGTATPNTFPMGVEGQILTYEVVSNPYFPTALASNAYAVAFGQFNNFCVRRSGIRIQVDTSNKITSLKTIIVAHFYYDGVLRQPGFSDVKGPILLGRATT